MDDPETHVVLSQASVSAAPECFQMSVGSANLVRAVPGESQTL